jgi:hypothetical protein
MLKPQREYDLSVIPDYDADFHDRWGRTQTLRPDENDSAYDREVWHVSVRTPSPALVRALTKYWRKHEDLHWLMVYDQTMACSLRLHGRSYSDHLIEGFQIVGDIAIDDEYVAWTMSIDQYDEPGELVWWDGKVLREVPMKEEIAA